VVAAPPVAPAPPPVTRNAETPAGPRERRAVREHLTDAWGIGAAVVLGGFAGVMAAVAGAGPVVAAGAAVIVAALVYAVRVVLGVVFES
jgi:hypothetical protein